AGFLYGSHPYGRPIEGLSATVPKLGRGDVADFYERWYRPNDTILVLVGDVFAAEATVRLREAFGAWRPRPDALPVRAARPPRLGPFTKPPTTTETLALALSVEGAFRSHAPARERLAKAKTYLRGQFPLRIESPDALAARLAEAEFNALGPEELATYRARVA